MAEEARRARGARRALFEISTDKVDTEIPSPAAGTLAEMLVEEGKTVGINTVVARIERCATARAADRGSRPAAAAPPPRSAAPARRRLPRSAPRPSRSRAAPPAPSAAAEPRIPDRFRRWCATWPREQRRPEPGKRHRRRRTHHQAGPGGYLAQTAAAGRRRAVSPGSTGSGARVSAPARLPPAAPPRWPRWRRSRPGQDARRADEHHADQKIAEHMVMTKRTSAHVTTVHKSGHDQGGQDARAAQGRVPGPLRFVADLPAVHHPRGGRGAARSIPLLNASIEGNNIIYHNEINIGIAVALENGLIVPVIRNADEKNVLGLQRSIVDLATRARSRQLKPDEVRAARSPSPISAASAASSRRR